MNKMLIALAGTAALVATPALAQPPAHAGGGKHAAHGAMHAQPACPPGLAKKRNGCLPPGQAKKRYETGYRFDRAFSGYTPYDRIPYELRNRYDLDPRSRYIYDDNYIYRVDPTTLIVREVLRAIL
ncbi:hypothetical protein [Sphingomicrobium astaxanthinifaciens]|uniref:hypothetical protein n=1 Tax=Sphingomicrobium astaxanthinifaciens TaxID=1227949 RepID=UPI001FCC5945|nr:hypothetical protein [Sphingomicrobium astaxanthinifaciens]MCJ7421670.1 hypothetical protein [Sphingomicrobium astaxanthinifaciens]